MTKPQTITRGQLYFDRPYPHQIRCTLGKPEDPESEHVFTVDESFAPDMIAGLKAMQQK